VIEVGLLVGDRLFHGNMSFVDSMFLPLLQVGVVLDVFFDKITNDAVRK
jgi:hypothetical protein